MITIRDLTVRFGDKTVYEGRSFSLPDTGVVLLMGESGCGKTTLLRILAGLLKPHSGKITGISHRKVSVAFQEPRLLGWRTARENLLLVTDERNADELLRSLELTEAADQRADTLSGGQQQRISIARAFAHSRDVVLLDEPFSGLDEANRSRVRALIKTAALAVVVTHDETDAAFLQADTTIHF